MQIRIKKKPRGIAPEEVRISWTKVSRLTAVRLDKPPKLDKIDAEITLYSELLIMADAINQGTLPSASPAFTAHGQTGYIVLYTEAIKELRKVDKKAAEWFDANWPKEDQTMYLRFEVDEVEVIE